MTLFWSFIGFSAVMSAVAAFLFFWDKQRAVHGKERIKECYLLCSAAVGGAPGAGLGALLAHHKTRKFYFGLVILVSLGIQAVTAWSLWRMAGGAL